MLINILIVILYNNLKSITISKLLDIIIYNTPKTILK